MFYCRTKLNKNLNCQSVTAGLRKCTGAGKEVGVLDNPTTSESACLSPLIIMGAVPTTLHKDCPGKPLHRYSKFYIAYNAYNT